MNEETASLLAWSAACEAKLGIDDVVVDREALHILLDLSRDAAHQVLRPASPVTCYLVGLAVGRGMSLGRAAALATALARAAPGAVGGRAPRGPPSHPGSGSG